MLESLGLYAGGVLVGAIITRGLYHARGNASTQLAETEIGIANVAFIRAASDELDDETMAALGQRANDYCEEWDAAVRFNPEGEEVTGE